MALVRGHARPGDRPDQVGAQSHADRYTYIPLIGVFIVIAWGAYSALSSIVSTRSLYALGAATLAVLAMWSHAQAGRWRESMTLYEHDLRVVGDNPLVENLIGVTLADQGRHADAVPRFERALRLSPSYVRAYDNLGLALIKTGRAADAVHPWKRRSGSTPARPSRTTRWASRCPGRTARAKPSISSRSRCGCGRTIPRR